MLLADVARLLAALRAEGRVTWTERRDRAARRAILGCAAALVGLAVLGLAASERGLTGTVTHTLDEFTKVKRQSQYDPVRLVSTNSGNPVYGIAGQNGRGQLLAGSLEMSNVDLSAEFTNLILAQRGFQANSKVITSSDEILQDLVNLKR